LDPQPGRCPDRRKYSPDRNREPARQLFDEDGCCSDSDLLAGNNRFGALQQH
ncbi:MAG: hypothetical protein Q9187_008468, partial [Circinaria calcarea]